MNIDDDKLPDDPFGDDNERSIEDLIREDREEAEAEDAILNQEKSEGRTKKIIIAGVGLLATAGIMTSIFLFDPFSVNTQNVGEKDPAGTSANPSDNGGGEGEYDGDQIFSDEEENKIAPKVDNTETFYLEQDKFFPVEKDEWQQGEYSSETLTEQKDAVLESISGTPVMSASGILPPESAGFTSNDSQMELEDGALNPNYSYWTDEQFASESSILIERLLNPNFGGWAVVQYPEYPGNEAYDPNLLRDMFTYRFLEANDGKAYSEYIPIYADWNGDNYGENDNLLETGPRWYGELTDSNYEFVYDDDINQYVVNMTGTVKYTAWAKDQTKLEKNATIKIKFVSNANEEGEEGHKILIDEASLKVE